MATHAGSPPRPSSWSRAVLVLPAIGVVLAGIWIAGGVLTNDFRTSMALTAGWFALVAGAAVIAWRRAPVLRAAAVAALATFAIAGSVLALGTLRDVTVNERIAAGPTQLSGGFSAGAHPTEGTAAVVTTGGEAVLTLTDFRTDAGPDLFVYIVPGGGSDGVDGGVRLGSLKGNIGNQQYALPAGLELDDGASVVIWCRAFSVSFGAAALSAA